MKSLRLPLLLLCAVGALTVSVRAQAPARYKRIVITLISRALDKQYPAVLSDANYRINGVVLATDTTPPAGGYADHSIGRSLKFGVTHELFVYHRPNTQATAVAVVSGSAAEAGTTRKLFGLGLGTTPEAAEQAAIANLTGRHPLWARSGTPHKVEGRANYAAGEPVTNLEGRKVRVLVTIPWKYVPAVSASAQTELGYAIAFNTEYPVPRGPVEKLFSLIEELDETSLHSQNLDQLEKLKPFDQTRSVSRELPVGSGMDIVVVSASIPTLQGPILKVYGVGITDGRSGPSAMERALKNLGANSWGWSEKKHGYQIEYSLMTVTTPMATLGVRG